MRDLQGLMKGFLISAGYSLIEEKTNFIIADKPFTLGSGLRDVLVVWIAPIPRNSSHQKDIERQLLKDFVEQTSRYPDARYLVLAHTLEFSTQFKRIAYDLRIKLNVPANVFDAPFKVEESEQATTALAPLRDVSLIKQRVPQPFTLIRAGVEGERGDDLLTYLRKKLEDVSRPKLRIIVGPAGVGKSVLFRSLFAILYEEFKRRKRARQVYPRPIPLLPEYLQFERFKNVDALISGFLQTEVATPLNRDSFEWMLANGFLLWAFDGLDELYSRDPSFFDYLLDLLTREESSAQILICARESLLTSSEPFADFLENYSSGGDTIRVYRLDKWNRPSVRTYAWLRTQGKVPVQGASDPVEVSRFLGHVDSIKTVSELAGLPFYCDLLMEVFLAGEAFDFQDEMALVNQSVNWIIQRDCEKGLIDKDDFAPGGLEDWLDAVATDYFENGFTNIKKNDVEAYGDLALRDDLTPEKRADALTKLVQSPLFASGESRGALRFQHEIVAELLAARNLIRRIEQSPESVGRVMGARIDLGQSFLLRCMSKLIQNNPNVLRALGHTLQSGVLQDRPFANLLQLFVLADPDKSQLSRLNLAFDNRDLRYVRFKGTDLKGHSFRNANLSFSVFEACDLQGAYFEGAVLFGTQFKNLPPAALREAQFGDLEHFNFVVVDSKKFDDAREFSRWLQTKESHFQESSGFCPAAQQLRILFKKFVNPDGSGRRDDLKISALRAGKRFPGAPPVEMIIERCRRLGYLVETNRSERLRRAPGDKYNDMVNFVRNWSLTQELRLLLNSICDISQCPHVPR
jgi:hypothetical protein